MTEFADDPAALTALLCPVIARYESGIHPHMQHHWLPSAIEEVSQLLRERRKTAVETNHHKWIAAVFFLRLTREADLRQLVTVHGERLLYKNRLVVAQGSNHILRVTAVPRKDERCVSFSVLKAIGRTHRSIEAK
jgi:hypothetical protein